MLNNHIERYLTHLQTKRRVSPASLKNYSSTLNQFSAWLGDRDLTADSVEAWLSSIPHAPTANVKAVRISGLAKFIGQPLELTRAKEPTKEPEALTSREILMLESAADADTAKVIRFLTDTGLRFSEFIGLTPASLLIKDGETGLQIIGKGRKARWVPLSAAALPLYQNEIHAAYRTDYAQNQLRHSMAAAGKKAGLPVHIHPHLLRASCMSIMMNERGAEALHVAQLVGHSNIQTMLTHYCRTSAQALSGLVNYV